jgi:hypothetical protein
LAAAVEEIRRRGERWRRIPAVIDRRSRGMGDGDLERAPWFHREDGSTEIDEAAAVDEEEELHSSITCKKTPAPKRVPQQRIRSGATGAERNHHTFPGR